MRAELQQAARTFERATRSRVAADHAGARALRASVRALLWEPPTAEDRVGPAMLLDALITAVAHAVHWHRDRQHGQQEAAARRTLPHLRTAGDRTAGPVLEELARHAPTPSVQHRYAHHVRRLLPAHADRVLTDPAWKAFTAALATAESAGHNPAALLGQALRHRSLDDVHSLARVLTWRVHRLGQRRAPSPRAQVARALPVPSRVSRPRR